MTKQHRIFALLMLTFVAITAISANVNLGAENETVTSDSINVIREKSAQEIADSLYLAYNNAEDFGADKRTVFTLLSNCCECYENLLKTKDITPTDYVKAKDRLRRMRQQLQYGGVYFSQQNEVDLAVKLLEQYIMIPKLDVFKDELFSQPEYYPSLVYYVASAKYNFRDFESALFYLQEYLATGDLEKERNALISMSMAYGYMLDDENQILTLMRAQQKYPKDAEIVRGIVDFHIRMRNASQAELYIDLYEQLTPDPMTLYVLKAKIAELKGDYVTCLKICEALYQKDPNNYDYIKLYARNSYNYVVMEMKNGKVTSNGKPAKELRPYLENAAKLFVIVVNNNPEKAYLDGLIDTYLLLDRRDEAMMVAKRIGRQIDNLRESNKIIAEKSSGTFDSGKVTKNGVPYFSVYMKDYMSDKLRVWMQKGEFEKKADYEERTSGEQLEAKKLSLAKEAKELYIRQYGATMQINGIVIDGYDADHEVYLIKYNLGNMLVHVPIEGDEAKSFQDDWGMGLVRVAEPKFDISGDSLILAGLTFVSPKGKSYRYDISEKLKYEDVDVKIVNPMAILDENLLASLDIQDKKTGQDINKTTIEIGNVNRKSDIDVDIPQDSILNSYTFALIISNENYKYVDKVNYALDDGNSFEEYCRKTLGIPKKNIIRLKDASFLSMKGEVMLFSQLVREYADKARILVYYSGHGVPSFETQEAFLLPVDGSPLNMSETLSLNEFYALLSETNVNTINVFLDCCFSGASKSGNMLMAARGTVIKPKANEPKDNMIVMSACSGDEIAFHYADQHHGMFTYFLLKKLKETQGSATLGEIYDYVKSNVRRQALHDMKRKQEPNIVVATPLYEIWESMKLK